MHTYIHTYIGLTRAMRARPTELTPSACARSDFAPLAAIALAPHMVKYHLAYIYIYIYI